MCDFCGNPNHVIVPDSELAVNHVLKALQLTFPNEVWDDSAEETARRVVKFWREFSPEKAVITDFASTPSEDLLPFNFTTFKAEYNQMIVVRDIEFSSLCAHHLLPFYGSAHIAYIPNELQVGLSKIPRLVKFLADRPQVQENLTGQLATYLKRLLKCHGVMVVIESRHTCMSCRGVRAHSASMVTSDLRGVFLTNQAAREEFLSLINRVKF
jgi:GTP cyclohydrolase I